MNESHIDEKAKIIYDYMLMHHDLETADLILVCGNDDEMTTERALELYNENYAPLILISGSGSEKNREGFKENEALIMQNYLTIHGVPAEKILIEDKARSTGDNALLSKKLLEEKNIVVHKIILVTKPYMERRAYATFEKQTPGPYYMITSKLISYDEYQKNFPDKAHFINLMVGDLLRIKEYPKLGFQIEQEIPDNVWQAGQDLLTLGFDKYKI